MIAARTISQMFDQIKAAQADEQQTHRLRGLFGQVARSQGRQPTEAELDGAVQFVGEYINHVPLLLLTMTGAALKAGASEAIDPLLEACEQYWQTGFDVIPDHLGLLGYMDDAYYVLSIIQAVNQRHRQADGKPLMSIDLTPFNQHMRNLIGEPHATILDTAVAAVLAAPGLTAILQKLQQFSGGFLVDRDPIWGDASIDDIVSNRMGALGFV
jgi:hypothetical protein